jgi:hypothetical protein
VVNVAAQRIVLMAPLYLLYRSGRFRGTIAKLTWNRIAPRLPEAALREAAERLDDCVWEVTVSWLSLNLDVPAKTKEQNAGSGL